MGYQQSRCKMFIDDVHPHRRCFTQFFTATAVDFIRFFFRRRVPALVPYRPSQDDSPSMEENRFPLPQALIINPTRLLRRVFLCLRLFDFRCFHEPYPRIQLKLKRRMEVISSHLSTTSLQEANPLAEVGTSLSTAYAAPGGSEEVTG